jgi:hypothetical protein
MNDPARRHGESEPSQARCGRCGESFVIADGFATDVHGSGATELLHLRRRGGEVCGGIGVPFRKYVIRNPNRF